MKIEDIWGLTVNKAIGQGSYGTVYSCEDANGKKSAVKVISIPHDDDDMDLPATEKLTDEQTKEYYREIVDNFVNEIKLLETLKGNKNIVSIEDSRVIENEEGIGWKIFIKMELLQDLTSYASRNELNEATLVKMAIDLCEGLKICGAKKIIHRDIKPENIFVDEDGNFKLGDFGVAKQLENTEASMSRKGTYNYMAPEVFNSKKYDSRADIYSLGIVMYRILNNNRLPFIDPEKQIVKYSEREEAFEKRMKGDKIPPLKNVNESLNRVILRACEYRQEDRFNNIDEFQKALVAIQGGNKFKFHRVTHWVSNNKVKSLIAAVLALAIVSGGVACALHYKDKLFLNRYETLGTSAVATDIIYNESNVAENKSTNEIEYSGMCDGIYTHNHIDYVAGYDFNFYAISKTEKKKLSDQKVTSEFTIINDKIYYTVIDDKKEFKYYGPNFTFAICSCWTMNLDGSNQTKLFDYNGAGQVIYADEKTIYYCDDSENFEEHNPYGFKLLVKYDIETKKSAIINPVANDDSDYPGYVSFAYHSGYIACIYGSDEEEMCSLYRYSIKNDEFELVKNRIDGDVLAMCSTGEIYYRSIEGENESGISIKLYDIVNNKSYNTNLNYEYFVKGNHDAELILYKYSDETSNTSYYRYYSTDTIFDVNNYKLDEVFASDSEYIYDLRYIDDDTYYVAVSDSLYGQDGLIGCSWKLMYYDGNSLNDIIINSSYEDSIYGTYIGENSIALSENYRYNNAETDLNIYEFSKLNANALDVDFPYLCGLEAEEAKKYLEFIGYDVKIDNSFYDNDYEEGYIIDYLSSDEEYGDTITLYESKGIASYEIDFVLPTIEDDSLHDVSITFDNVNIINDTMTLDGTPYWYYVDDIIIADGENKYVVGDLQFNCNAKASVTIDGKKYYEADYSIGEGFYNEQYYS